MKLQQVANEVTLRVNDVALRANERKKPFNCIFFVFWVLFFFPLLTFFGFYDILTSNAVKKRSRSSSADRERTVGASP